MKIELINLKTTLKFLFKIMDYQRFLDGISSHYENWKTSQVTPINPKFKSILQNVKGMTTANIMQLLNWAVDCLEEEEVYCEIGSFQGSTLIGALIDHPGVMGYAIDNFSQFNQTGGNLAVLNQNLSNYGISDQAIIHNQNFEEFFFNLKQANINTKIGVYFYDGAHDYRSQLLGLLMAVPFLSDRALIIVDDSNWRNVQQANFDFLATHPQATLVMDLPTQENWHCTFLNGLHIISWDVTHNNQYQWSDFAETFRHVPTIEFIYHNLFIQYELKYKAKLKELEKKALALEQLDQLEEAEEIYTEIIKLEPRHFVSWYHLGLISYQRKQYDIALKMTQKSLSINSFFDEARTLLDNLLAHIPQVKLEEK